MKPRLLLACCFLVVSVARSEETVSPHAPAAEAPSAEDIEYFESKIRPLLAGRCYSCHSEKARAVHGGLKLDSAQSLLAGGDTGPVIDSENLAESLFLKAIRHDADAGVQMPPKGKLPDHEIKELTEWVRRGAPFPPSSASAAPESKIDIAAGKSHWSFQPVSERPLPSIQDTQWPRQRVDHFLLSAMERAGLAPSPEADRAALLRRLSFDLIGLPPTPEEIAAFVNDPGADAYERQVDRLLESPHFGERWGRVWLDLARYTDKSESWLDSTGQAHLYRDWVVQAMNDDMPYDQFVHRQLATDLMPETGPEDTPALGFLGLSPNYWKELLLPAEIIKVIVADEWEERVDAVSRTFLGLTVACARCHDHKSDPITMQDYYSLCGVMASCRLTERPTISEELFAPVRAAREEVAKLEKEIAELKKQKPVPEDQVKELTAKIEEIKTTTPLYDTPMTPAVAEESLFVERKGQTPQEGTLLVYRPGPQDLNLFLRGDPNRLGDVVPRRFLQVLSRDDSQPFQNGSGRLELAQAITTDAAPLAARVIVNRIWLAHFGRGLVTTPSNFGVSGELPSHAELLDDLAARLIAGGWSLKALHREIVLSAAYRQTSRTNDRQLALDPENRLLSRMNRRRLEIESWRDAMLAASGKLELSLGGPSLELAEPGNTRRTVYGTIHRREISSMLAMHDFPDPNFHSEKRLPTTTALQGLYALNGPLFLELSDSLAQRLASEFPDDDTARIHRAYWLLYSREPTPREVEIGQSFITSQGADARTAAWAQYAHVLLAANEFLYVD